MHRIYLLFLLFLLPACNGPSPALHRAKGTEVMVGGSQFVIFQQGIRVEAVRTNFEFPATVRNVFPKAAIAIEQVTGCPPHLATMTGDAAHIKADLNCSASAPSFKESPYGL